MEDLMNTLTYPDMQLQEFDRVRNMSADKANRAIDASTRESIERATAGGRAAIQQRLAALQKEWDIDRVLMVNFAALVFAQLVAARRDRRWLWGPLVQTPFLMMHATLGWCPP
jgi:protein gp37